MSEDKDSSFKQYGLKLILAFAIFWTPAVTFAKIAGEILERQPIRLDILILTRIHDISSSSLDAFFTVITTLGNVELILPVSLLISAVLIYKKYRFKALRFVFALGGAAFANIVLKLLFHRNRPSLWHPSVVESGYSFPSGHAMMSSALALTIIFLLWNSKWRIISIILGALFVLAIGFSRLYLGVHYPTDIIGGWIVSFLWVAVVFYVTQEVSHRYHNRQKVSPEE